MANLLNGMREVFSLYDLYLIDLWGVIHDGKSVFSEANKCLYELSKLKKLIIFLSNSPKRSFVVQEHLRKAGLLEKLDYEIYTSGEHAYQKISNEYGTMKNPARTRIGAFFLGPFQHEKFKEGLPFSFLDNIENSNLIINTGFLLETDQISDYQNMLEVAKQKELILYCINPDQFAIDCGQRILCAGLIAEKYQSMGGNVIYYGKPHESIYDSIYEKYNIPKSKILAVGDSLYSDIKGARNFGVSSLLVLSGIHASNINILFSSTSEIIENTQRLFGMENINPDYMMPYFKW